MMVTESALHGRITGKVQGVFFRAETRQQARELGLRGWVRNTPDGAVEVLLAGPEQALERMRAWLHQGPPRARVDKVELSSCDDPGLGEFEIRA